MSFFPQPASFPSPLSTSYRYVSYSTGGSRSASSGGSGVLSPALGSGIGSAVGSVDGKTDTSSLVSSASYQSDPVTKAVVDNIMGNLPTKKERVTLRCEVCNLEFSGQVVLETHLAGAKHAKKLKSQEILQQLESSGQTFSRDTKTSILKCEICEVVVNSSQQLQTHLAGNKHKQKATKRGSPGSSSGIKITPKLEGTGAENGKGAENGDSTLPDIPSGVQKVMEGSGSKSSKFFCEPCKASLNSSAQLQQHLESRKHSERVAGTAKKSRYSPYWKRGRPTFGGARSKPRPPPPNVAYSQPLSNNFIAGGSML